MNSVIAMLKVIKKILRSIFNSFQRKNVVSLLISRAAFLIFISNEILTKIDLLVSYFYSNFLCGICTAQKIICVDPQD